MANIKVLMQQGKIKEALVKFRALSESLQEDFLRRIAPTLFPPPFISVLFRKLHPGKTYEDFYEAHLPPLEKGQDLAHYFPIPVYVLSAQNKDDPSDIITIGLMWPKELNIEEALKSRTQTEKMRHENILQVADKIGDTSIYKVKKVIKLGS